MSKTNNPFPYSLSAANFINEEMNRMLYEGIIGPSKNPYNSPIWVFAIKWLIADGTLKQIMVVTTLHCTPETNYDIKDMLRKAFTSKNIHFRQ